MIGYRFKRRAFLASLGGAVGLSSMLQNLEASAEGQGPPARFLLLFWPCGTLPFAFRPHGQGRDYVASSILEPFERAGLRDDYSVLFGLKDPFTTNGGGGHEGGVVLRTTGVRPVGTRKSQGESDDAMAGGPSIDQVLLRRAPDLGRSGLASLNAIGDARVDSYEISARCLSYGYDTRRAPSASPGGDVTEHVPLLPELSPARQYARVFSGFMPGGSTDGNVSEVLRALTLRKSVLDYSLGELKRLQQLVPASERPKLDVHADAIRKLEQQLSAQLADGVPRGCQIPPAPDASWVALEGSHNYYAEKIADHDESATLAELGKLHLAVIRAAFQCDVVRVATFQWASALNPVGFLGLRPDAPDQAYRHHPLSHAIGGLPDEPPETEPESSIVRFLINVHTWFNQRTAEFIDSLKQTEDVFGGKLLDHTVVPFVTDVALSSHRREPLPALIFGGRALGLQGGQYQSFEAQARPFNDVWLTLAQAFLPRAESITTALAGEALLADPTGYSGPIPGLWQRPT